jgi:hypothetical protein
LGVPASAPMRASTAAWNYLPLRRSGTTNALAKQKIRTISKTLKCRDRTSTLLLWNLVRPVNFDKSQKTLHCPMGPSLDIKKARDSWPKIIVQKTLIRSPPILFLCQVAEILIDGVLKSKHN